MIGLRFLIKGGAFLGVVMEERAARDLVQKWVNGEAPERFGGDSPVGVWGIQMTEVVAIHTFDPSQVQGTPTHVSGRFF